MTRITSVGQLRQGDLLDLLVGETVLSATVLESPITAWGTVRTWIALETPEGEFYQLRDHPVKAVGVQIRTRPSRPWCDTDIDAVG